MGSRGITPIDIQRFLGGMKYPSARGVLVDHAEAAGADREILDLLLRLPDRNFASPADLSHAVAVILAKK